MAIKKYNIEIFKNETKVEEKQMYSFSSELLKKKLRLNYQSKEFTFKLKEIPEVVVTRKRAGY